MQSISHQQNDQIFLDSIQNIQAIQIHNFNRSSFYQPLNPQYYSFSVSQSLEHIQLSKIYLQIQNIDLFLKRTGIQRNEKPIQFKNDAQLQTAMFYISRISFVEFVYWLNMFGN